MANQNSGTNSHSGKSSRGFASMDPERQREIASAGGRASRSNANTNRGETKSSVQTPPSSTRNN